jgi:hypothetical protein
MRMPVYCDASNTTTHSTLGLKVFVSLPSQSNTHRPPGYWH